MSDEILWALDESGSPLPEGVPRPEAHRRGVWHRAVSIFVINPYGEILLEKRSEHKDLFPGHYDIPGGHVKFGQDSHQTALEELNEELGLVVPIERVTQVTQREFVERVFLPDKGIINLERKTAYLVEIDEEEEAAILVRAAQDSRLSAKELEQKGPQGEVSHVEFWSWERLQEALNAREGRILASGTESALSNASVSDEVEKRCLCLRCKKQERFWDTYGNIFGDGKFEKQGEQSLVMMLLEPPEDPAEEGAVAAIFEQGPAQLAGAYQLGSFRRLVSGDSCWDAKIHDTETVYVNNILDAIFQGRDSGIVRSAALAIEAAQKFVAGVLNLPLTGGDRFRDKLGNLVDIAAGRKAVLLWLEHNARGLLSEEDFLHPLMGFVRPCLQASRCLLREWTEQDTSSGLERMRALILLASGAAAVDFNNPEVQQRLSHTTSQSQAILDFVREKTAKVLCPELGSDCFLEEFFRNYVANGQSARITFLAGNSAQAFVSLAICQELLEQNPRLQVFFVPKSGTPGNDLNCQDAETAMRSEEGGLLSALNRHFKEGRFVLVPNGPTCHGLDPARLSRDASEALREATVVVAEGQAYAEIRGWRKPTYVAFRVNGRVAEAIHGISRRRSAYGFVRLSPGIEHFEGFDSSVLRRVVDPVDGHLIPAASQSTSEYVSAVLGENFNLLVARLFHGDQALAGRQVRAEAERLGKTFAQVLIGVASAAPDPQIVAEHYRRRHYPVFACGGGGGFNAVTLKALRMLGLPVVAGVPSTDDGGSSGELQSWFRDRRGFVFGVGDLAAIMQDALANKGKQAILAFRLDSEPLDLAVAVLERIAAEVSHPTYADSAIGSAPDFLSFVCDQLNLARVIDKSFRRSGKELNLSIKKTSVRNLNVLAAYELCGSLGDRRSISSEARLAAVYVLEKALGIDSGIMVLPVTYEECALYLEYEDPVSSTLAEASHIPQHCLQHDGHRLFGQHFIDTLPQKGRRRTAGVVTGPGAVTRPDANPEYLARLRKASLFIMGAGSLVSSQLAQLAVPGVVESLLARTDMRRILVLNHVKMDETREMSLQEHIRLIETVATQSVQGDVSGGVVCDGQRFRISELFTDVVVPRTVAREVEAEMAKRGYYWDSAQNEHPVFEELPSPRGGGPLKVFRNRYVDFLLTYPEVREELGITLREVEVLSYMEQPQSLYRGRTEAGRYRGALFATDQDIQYLIERGIQPRNIHQIDSIGQNWKLLKTEGAPSFEFFPGLVPEALLGIIKIALERGTDTLISVQA